MNDSSGCDRLDRARRFLAATGLLTAACARLLGAACAVVACFAGTVFAQSPLAVVAPLPMSAAPAVAFFYGANPPLDELKAFDIVVVEPDHVADPRPHRRPAAMGASELFAYVSFGEIEPTRAYFKEVPAGVLKGENRAWGSSVIDHTAPAWPDFLIERILAPLWERGYRGFFLDTLDSYHLISATPAARAAQETAMVAILRRVRERFPGMRLVFNRGFEILPQVREMVTAVAAESLFQGWDQEGKRYREVPAADRDWLLGQLRTAQSTHKLPVIAIDYVAPGDRALARATARKILDLGFTPWVANPALDMLGVGRVEVVPRRVLILTERPDGDGDFQDAPAQRFLGMPLNHLGYTYELRDPRFEPLPEGELRGLYAGVVMWLSELRGPPESRVADFFRRQIASGVRVAVFNQFPFVLDGATATLAGLNQPRVAGTKRLAIVARDPMMGHEREPLASRRDLVPLVAGPTGRPLLRLTDGGAQFDGAAIMPWGGFVLSPYSYVSLEIGEQHRWVVNPLSFLAAAFAREDLPVPDATTEGGRRMLLVHVDGDGWASRAEMPGAPFASEVMAAEILERFRIPTTVSVIEGEVSARGLYAASAQALENIARRIYRLPHVEAASHSFSHPFNWRLAAAPSKPGDPSYILNIPGYRFDLAREVTGSVDYINRTLLPAGKRVDVFLWTGDCAPPPAALSAVHRGGLLNMNGGDTLINRSNPSWTLIAAQGIRKDTWYQVFAPMQNENVYTNNWTGPFYGYERVIETFELTEAPHRFKPINIYYHTYSASKVASLKALRKVYEYAMAQPVTPVHVAEYIRKVLDFERMAMARDLVSGDLIVRGDGALRTLRSGIDAAVPDLATSVAVAGYASGPNARYITLAGPEARLALGAAGAAPNPAHAAYLFDANGAISEIARAGGAFGFTLTSHVAPSFRLANAERCTVTINGKPARAGIADRAGPAGIALLRHDADPNGLGRAPHQQVVRVRCLQ